MSLRILLIILSISVVACNKKVSTSCKTTPNHVTITDNGIVYEACGDYRQGITAGQAINNGVLVYYDRGRNPSIDIYAANDYPFSITLYDSMVPVGGLGTYLLLAIDSNANLFSENFAGGHSYKCSQGIISVTDTSLVNVAGTFTVNVFNSSETKVISGAFNVTHPIILN